MKIGKITLVLTCCGIAFQTGMAQELPKWANKARKAVFSVITYNKGLASAASKVPPTDCLGAKILPQNPQNSQKLLLGIFSHRFHGIHRNSCWGYSPTDFTDLHRLFGCLQGGALVSSAPT